MLSTMLAGPRCACIQSTCARRVRFKKKIEDVGVKTLMWGSDYGDGVWTESSQYIDEQFAHLPADVQHKITCENAGKLYGLIN